MKGREAEYQVDAAWPVERPEDVDETLRILLERGDCFFHGAHEPWKELKASLDLWMDANGRRGEGHALERTLLDRFGRQSFRHLQPGPRKHIELARLKWGTYRTTGTLFVARHYGLPTRAVDWTREALVALLFACRRTPEKDGVIWCMGREAFESCVQTQWPAAYGKEGGIVDDFERDFIEGHERDILVPLYFPKWMRRAIAQQALITVAGRFGIDHARKIHELGAGGCSRVLIHGSLKQAIIERLDLMGINGYTLGIGDSTIETIGTDIAASLPPVREADGAGGPPALLVIDLQRWFLEVGPVEKLDRVKDLIDRTNELIDCFHRRGWPVVQVQTVHDPDGGTWNQWMKRHRTGRLIDGTPEAQVHPDIRRGPDDIVLRKTRHSAFVRTDLEGILRERGVEAVVLAGFSIDACVGLTALDAWERDFAVVLAEEAILGTSQAAGERMLAYLRERFEIEPQPVDTILKRL